MGSYVTFFFVLKCIVNSGCYVYSVLHYTLYVDCTLYSLQHTIEEESNKSKGKGRDLAPGWFEEKDYWKTKYLPEWMSKKLYEWFRVVWTGWSSIFPNHPFSLIFFVLFILFYKWQVQHSIKIPRTSNDDLCLSFFRILLLGCTLDSTQYSIVGYCVLLTSFL